MFMTDIYFYVMKQYIDIDNFVESRTLDNSSVVSVVVKRANACSLATLVMETLVAFAKDRNTHFGLKFPTGKHGNFGRALLVNSPYSQYIFNDVRYLKTHCEEYLSDCFPAKAPKATYQYTGVNPYAVDAVLLCGLLETASVTGWEGFDASNIKRDAMLNRVPSVLITTDRLPVEVERHCDYLVLIDDCNGVIYSAMLNPSDELTDATEVAIVDYDLQLTGITATLGEIKNDPKPILEALKSVLSGKEGK